MIVKFYEEEFLFEPRESNELVIKGFLDLDEGQRETFVRLDESEDHCWYLGDEGKRLDTNALFAASPWRMLWPSGEVKLLCSFHDNQTDEIWFNTEDESSSELSEWLKEQL
jgi:hypothetical protein